MCGRYGFGNPARLGTLPFGAALPLLTARFNLTPSQPVPLVRETSGGRDALLARWGLVPFWADDPSIGNRLANARGDTVATKPSFRAAFRQRRGLMPVDLFYEWQVIAGQKVKQPWCIRLPDDEPFAFGAIWEQWTPKHDPGAEPLITCAIITTEPNAVMAPIHDRMPVIMPPDHYEAWLDPSTRPAVAQSLVQPYAGPMLAWPVSTRVNSPRTDDAECITPLA
ncbi:MAG: SOS response-associated peptidase [Gemmatimonadaceae bacterium]|nr:SOS response-associated peptidase [Gemmatimonadaceae bacterium]